MRYLSSPLGWAVRESLLRRHSMEMAYYYLGLMSNTVLLTGVAGTLYFSFMRYVK